MAVELTGHNRDGRLCTAVFVITGTGGAINASTSTTVVGHIVQIGMVSSGDGDSTWTLELKDTTNSMVLYSDTNLTADVTPNNVNSGSGGYCRGVLQCGTGAATTLLSGAIKTITVYYIKM